MTIAKTGQGSAGGVTTTGTVTATASSVGDFLVLILHNDGHTASTNPIATVTDTNLTWTFQGADNSTAAGKFQRTEIWTAKNPAGAAGNANITWSGAIDAWSASIVSFSGVDVTTPILNSVVFANNYTGVANTGSPPPPFS